MNKIKKFLNKINKKERAALLKKIKLLEKRKIDDLDIKKIQTSNLYRLRVGKIRVIFRYSDSLFKILFIGWRDDNTYKKLKNNENKT